MGSFGIIRKVDELGRIVIPKEIRKILDIKSGSSLEIIVSEEKELVLKKFSEVKNLSGLFSVFMESFFSIFQIPIVLCDEEKIIYVVGVNKKEFLYKDLSREVLEIDCKETQLFNGNLIENQKSIFEDSLIMCLYSEGCMCGKLILIKKEEGFAFTGEVLSSFKLMVEYITRVLNFE